MGREMSRSMTAFSIILAEEEVSVPISMTLAMLVKVVEAYFEKKETYPGGIQGNPVRSNLHSLMDGLSHQYTYASSVLEDTVETNVKAGHHSNRLLPSCPLRRARNGRGSLVSSGEHESP